MEAADIALCFAVLIVAFLYSSVGHAGASGYIAVMALASVASPMIRPTALVLNIIVATIGSVQFWRAGHFRWTLFWPFALTSIPAAYYGGMLTLPTRVLNILIGLVLLASAARLLVQFKPVEDAQAPMKPVAMLTGGVLGFLAGLTGTGGGIFLTPVMILLRWSSTKQAAAVSVVYILVNSASGLLGTMRNGIDLPSFLWPMIGAVVVGGSLGSYLGSRRFPVPVIHVLLATVLILAGGKLMLTKPPAPKTEESSKVAHGEASGHSRARHSAARPLPACGDSVGGDKLRLSADFRQRREDPMPGKRYSMNAGRTTKQGQQINVGKDGADYQAIVNTIHMNVDDMKEEGITAGSNVRVISEQGEAVFLCQVGKVPPGLIFVPYGPPTCRLMGQTTDGTGMPTSKGWEVEVEPIAG